MSKEYSLLIEEYVPAALFLHTSFKRDREELFGRFSIYTPDYLVGFEKQIEKVKNVEKAIVLTTEQKEATNNLYVKADAVNVEFNFLSRYFKKAKLDTKEITLAKKDLNSRNIEGATFKISGIIQLIVANKDVLVSKGMAADYVNKLQDENDFLTNTNVLQNDIKINIGKLYTANKTEYDKLYEYISEITADGKVMYARTNTAKEYTISKIIERLRSPNKGGGGDKPAAPSA